MIIYTGPSQIDGAPIVAIATTGSKNHKTGDMVQTYILRADVHPVEALRTGADASICGSCQLRPIVAAARKAAGENPMRCYVKVWREVSAVWRKFARGGYDGADTKAARAAIGHGRMVRLGSYGDPAAVPAQVWRDLISGAIGHTGYTHQHAAPGNARLTRNVNALRGFVMASVETTDQAIAAHAKGWRTFRVRPTNEPGALLGGERVCPASAESGRRMSCETCGACAGADGRKSPGIAIIDHGPGRRPAKVAA